MKRIQAHFVLVCSITILIAGIASAQERQQDHDELRAMLRSTTEAMNSKNFDALTPLFYGKCSITTVDQKLFTGVADFKAYYEGLYNGEHAVVRSIVFKPEADALTEFVCYNICLSHGTSADTYTFADGDVRTMAS